MTLHWRGRRIAMAELRCMAPIGGRFFVGFCWRGRWWALRFHKANPPLFSERYSDLTGVIVKRIGPLRLTGRSYAGERGNGS